MKKFNSSIVFLSLCLILLSGCINNDKEELNVITSDNTHDELSQQSSIKDTNVIENDVVSQPEQQKIDDKEGLQISDTDIIAVVEKYLWQEDGINVSTYPESNTEVNGKKYYYVEVVYVDRPAASLFVDVENELLFNGFGELDINSPLDFKTIKDLQQSGVEIIEDQSFQLPYSEKVRFISSLKDIDDIKKAQFYLTNNNDLVIYELPTHYVNQFGYVSEIVAISFQDVDDDDDKDIIVICSVMSGVGENGAIPFYVPDIYFQQEYGTYTTDIKLSEKLYTDIETINISNIVDYMKKR